MLRIDLNFSNLYCIRPVEDLNHTDVLAIYGDDEDVAALNALRKVTGMAGFVPTSPRRVEQVCIHAAAKLL
jgi:hypothetical protein